MRRIVSGVPCTGDESEELEEPLLGHGEDSTSSPEAQPGSQQGGSRALVPHSINRINWEELWRVLWGNCCNGFAGVLGEMLRLPRLSQQGRAVQGCHGLLLSDLVTTGRSGASP